jgi:ketosteroid isomerase-like protein
MGRLARHLGRRRGRDHYRGREGVASWLKDLYSAWETFDMEAEELIDAGDDQVITVLSARGRGRASGIEVEHHPAGVGTLRDDKLVRVVWFAARDEALAAAGLRE